jgi:hypothetical protein
MRGQQLRVLVLGVVVAFLIEREEAGEDHHLAGGAQAMLPGAVEHLDRGALQPRRGHLAGERALEDQIIKPP